MKDKKRVVKNQRKIIKSRNKSTKMFTDKIVKYGNMEIRKSIAELRWRVKLWFDNKQQEIID